MKVSRKSWRPAPALVVSVTAVCVIALVFTVNWLSARRQRFTANVEIADPLVERTGSAASPVAKTVRTLPDGEIERTALRVREVSALVTGLTLFTIREELHRRPVLTMEALLERFQSYHLLPPGISAQTAPGVLASENATLYLRFRPEPFALEMVSLGRTPLDGPAIIGRILTGNGTEAEASLFLARSSETVTLPRPFAPMPEMIAQHWIAEPLRERNFTEPELAQLNAWLRTQSAR